MNRADDARPAIVQRQGLTESERVAVDELKVLCDQLEGLDLAVNLALEGTPEARDTRRTVPIRLRRATLADVGAIGRVAGAAFGDRPDPHRQKAEREMGHHNVRYYVGELSDEPIGSLRLVWFDGRVYVTAFGVVPDLQGRGYGRQILSETIADLLAEGQDEIYIEVETNNRNALGLYRSCGFEETTA